MSILAAKCPCCGRDIGIEPDTEEYICVFCGTKLKVAALKTEPVDGALSDEKNSESKGSRTDESSKHGEHRHSGEHHSGEHHSGEHHSGEHRSGEHHSGEHRSGEHHSGEHHSGEHHSSSHHSGVHHRSAEEPEAINAPELTEEEINEQLKRKAEFKEELHTAVHQINELRARRPKLETKKRTITALGIVGVILAAGAGAAIFLFAEGDSDNTLLLIISGVVAALALAMLIISYVQRNDIKKQKVRLEESILEKKQKRDILIGRLNKINRTLHIHEE